MPKFFTNLGSSCFLFFFLLLSLNQWAAVGGDAVVDNIFLALNDLKLDSKIDPPDNILLGDDTHGHVDCRQLNVAEISDLEADNEVKRLLKENDGFLICKNGRIYQELDLNWKMNRLIKRNEVDNREGIQPDNETAVPTSDYNSNDTEEGISAPTNATEEVICDSYEHIVSPGSGEFWFYLIMSIGLVLFGGLMSGLTVGLMSLDVTTLSVLSATSKNPKERRQAQQLVPLLRKSHFLLVTLLLANAMAMEALPIFLDYIVDPVSAVAISVTAVLFFGEIIPQALCKRYGIAIGANTTWIVKTLMIILSPIAWPISKLLDYLLGHGHGTYYQRSQLKELVKLHGMKTEENQNPLTFNEIVLIRAVLEMNDKVVEQLMTPIQRVFMLSDDAFLTKETIQTIVERGFSRIPIYSSQDKNHIHGVLVVKKLFLVDQNFPPPISSLPVAKVLQVQNNLPLFNLLNDFIIQGAHLAVVHNSGEAVGIISIQDLFKELIQEEVEDQTAENLEKLEKLLKFQVKLELYTTKSAAVNGNPPQSELLLRELSEDKEKQVGFMKSKLHQKKNYQKQELDQSERKDLLNRKASSDDDDDYDIPLIDRN